MSTRSAFFPRSFSKNYPVAIRGEGCYLFDAQGKRYLDFSSSAVVSFIGHGDPDVADAIRDQLRDLEYVHSSQFVTEPAIQLAEDVLRFAGQNFQGGAVFFTSGGSEAVESALKLARQYQVEIGQASRYRVLSRKQAYHGSTFGAMTVSGNKQRRDLYLPMLKTDEQVNTPYCYRCAYGCEKCADQYAAEVEQIFERSGKEFAAFIFEPISGATLGAVAPPDSYLSKVADSCSRHGALLIADEVMTGFGRTGRNFAVEHWGVAPDIMVVGKGIASGYAPLGAVIASKKVVDAVANGSGSYVHGFTYNAHPLAMATGNEVLKKINQQALVQRAAGELSSALDRALSTLADCRSVGDVRGVGLLRAIEFVADKQSKRSFAPEIKISAKLGAAAAKRGVMVYPMQGCVDGTRGDHILIAPPAIIPREEIVTAVSAIRDAILEIESNQ